MLLSISCLATTLGLLHLLPGASSPPARAQVLRYVDDDAGCLGRSPCYGSVQAAVDAAGDGDVIDIAPGLYPERVSVINKSVHLRGPGAGSSSAGDDPQIHALIAPVAGDAMRAIITMDARSKGMDGPRVQGLRLRGATAYGILLVGRKVGDPYGLPSGLPPSTASAWLRGARIDDCLVSLVPVAGAPNDAGGVVLYHAEQARLTGVTVNGGRSGLRLVAPENPRLRDSASTSAEDAGVFVIAGRGLIDVQALTVAGAGRVGLEVVDAAELWLHRSTLTGAPSAVRLVERGGRAADAAVELRLGGSPGEGNLLTATGALALELVNQRLDALAMPDLEARYNDWGSPYGPEIEDRIRHQPDDARLGHVDFVPSLGVPVAVVVEAVPVELEADGLSRAQIRAVAQDAAGRPASDRSLAVFGSIGGLMQRPGASVEAERDSVARSGTWQELNDGRFGASGGGSYLFSQMPGATLEWSFDASAVLLRFGQSPLDGDRFRVRIDGVALGDLNTLGPHRGWDERLLARDLGPGTHRLTLELLAGELAVDALAAGEPLRNGQAEQWLQAPELLGEAQVSVALRGAPDGSLVARTVVPFVPGPPANLSLQLPPGPVSAGGARLPLEAVVRDARGRDVRDGTLVTFSVTSGLVDPALSYTRAGRAGSEFVSGTRPGAVTILARSAAISASAQVTVTAGAAASVAVTSTRTSLAANGFSRAPLLIRVRDAGGFAVADGTPVRLTTDLGSIEPALVVTEGGDARADLVAGSQMGRATVAATVDDVVGLLGIDLEGTDLRLQKTVLPQGVVVPGERITFTLRLANVGTGTVYDIHLQDPLPSGLVSPTLRASFVPRGPQLRNVDPNLPYMLSIDRLAPNQVGYVTVTSRIDTSLRWGVRKTVVNRAEARAPSAAEAHPEDNQSSAAIDVVSGAAFTVTLAASPEMPAGGSSIPVTARVTDRMGRPAADGTAVFFNLEPPDLASLGASVLTTVEGRVATRLVSGDRAGRVQVRAITVGDRSAQLSVRITPGPATTLLLASQRPRLVVGGQTTAVTATVTDRFANPVPQVLVNFSSNIGGLGVIDGLTSASGLVTTTLATGYRVGIARLRADSGNLVASLDLPVLAGPPASLSLSTDGSVLKLGQSAQVSAMVRDSYANPVSGALVDFAFDLGAMSPPSGATGTDGLARSRLSAQRGGVGLLEARVGALYRGIRIDVQGRRVFMPRLERRR